jgi:hypothetical protein
MTTKFDRSAVLLATDQSGTLQRIFDRICFEASIPRHGDRASRLARFLMDEFKVGNKDEWALTECGRWFCRPATPIRPPSKSRLVLYYDFQSWIT